MYTVHTPAGYIQQVRWDDDRQGILDVIYCESRLLARTFTAPQIRVVKQYFYYYGIEITIGDTAR